MSFCKGLLRNRGIEPICPSAIFKSPIADDQEQEFWLPFPVGKKCGGAQETWRGMEKILSGEVCGRALEESGDGEFVIVTLKLMGYKIKIEGDLKKLLQL